MELLEKLLTSTPLQLALVAIVLLALAGSPLREKVAGFFGHRNASEKVERIDGHGILRLVETSQVGLPRNWEKSIDDKIDHKFRTLRNSIEALSELMKDGRGQLKDIDEKVGDVQERIARMEGTLERRMRPRG